MSSKNILILAAWMAVLPGLAVAQSQDPASFRQPPTPSVRASENPTPVDPGFQDFPQDSEFDSFGDLGTGVEPANKGETVRTSAQDLSDRGHA